MWLSTDVSDSTHVCYNETSDTLLHEMSRIEE